MSHTVRWGLLGTAHINARVVPALRAARRSSILAVASRSADRAAACARDHDIQRAHASYEALLRDPEIDAVYIPLPNALHVEWTLRAIDAGKHVLCEKPLALSREDVDRVAAVAAARERVVVEGFMYRHEPQTARILELLRSDAIGPVQTIAAGFQFERSRANDVRLDPSLGGGSLWDVGCYAVNIARLVARADPIEVFGWAQLGSSGVDEAFTGLLRFAHPIVAIVQSSFRASHRAWLEVGGKDGVLRAANPFKPGPREQIELQRGDEMRHIAVEGSPMPFVRQIEDFVAAVIDGRAPAVLLADSRGNAATLAALHESARTGRPVAL